MAKAYEFLAAGFEDIEALAVVDVLRRGGIEVVTVSISDTREVASAHGITVMADVTFADVASFADADLLLLPGGMPGASNLRAHAGLCQLLENHAAAGRQTGAICAAPYILGELGLLEGHDATCYPGFESHLKGARYTARLVEESGLFVTGCGPAASLPYAYTLLRRLAGTDVAAQVAEGMRFNQLVEEVQR